MIDTLEDVDLESLVQEDTPIPCIRADKEWRMRFCKRPDEHPADWEVLWTCGCTFCYCETSITVLLTGPAAMCHAHGFKVVTAVYKEPIN